MGVELSPACCTCLAPSPGAIRLVSPTAVGARAAAWLAAVSAWVACDAATPACSWGVPASLAVLALWSNAFASLLVLILSCRAVRTCGGLACGSLARSAADAVVLPSRILVRSSPAVLAVVAGVMLRVFAGSTVLARCALSRCTIRLLAGATSVAHDGVCSADLASRACLAVACRRCSMMMTILACGTCCARICS